MSPLWLWLAYCFDELQATFLSAAHSLGRRVCRFCDRSRDRSLRNFGVNWCRCLARLGRSCPCSMSLCCWNDTPARRWFKSTNWSLPEFIRLALDERFAIGVRGPASDHTVFPRAAYRAGAGRRVGFQAARVHVVGVPAVRRDDRWGVPPWSPVVAPELGRRPTLPRPLSVRQGWRRDCPRSGLDERHGGRAGWATQAGGTTSDGPMPCRDLRRGRLHVWEPGTGRVAPSGVRGRGHGRQLVGGGVRPVARTPRRLGVLRLGQQVPPSPAPVAD